MSERVGRPKRKSPRQSPRAFLIWEIWAKADICGQNTITATPRISPTAIISVARFGRLCGRLSLILVTSISRARLPIQGPRRLKPQALRWPIDVCIELNTLLIRGEQGESPGDNTYRGFFLPTRVGGRARDIDHELDMKLRETRQHQ